MLTDAQIRALKPAGKLYRVSDGGGLYLEVAPSGKKTFRQTYRFKGRPRTQSHGSFPETKLSRARFLREELKQKIQDGLDPKISLQCSGDTPNQADRPEKTWREVVLSYLELERRSGRASTTIAKKTIHADVSMQFLSSKSISAIEPQDIIEVCQYYELQGKLTSSHAVRGFCSQVFRFAVANGWVQADPAALISAALARPSDVGHNGVTDPKRIGQLMLAIRSFNGQPTTRTGLILSAYLFPRNSEVRGMKWDQLDFEAATWNAPPELMKKKRAHVVPLPRQVIQELRFIQHLTGDREYVLSSVQKSAKNGQLSENTFNKALRKIGFGPEEHVHHGFRITASTTLYENEWPGDWIERQLAHVEDNKIKGAYNKALYLEGRAKMMQWYADWLDQRALEAESSNPRQLVL